MTLETQAAFARRIGHVKSHITDLKHAGRLVMVGEGRAARVDVEASLALIADTRDPNRDDVAARHAAHRAAAHPGAASTAAPPEPPAGQGAALPPLDADRTAAGFQRARAVKEHFAALQAKAEYEKAIGKLVESADVARAAADLGAWHGAAVEALVAQVAAAVSACRDPEQIHAVVAERLTEFSAAFAARVGDALKAGAAP